MSWKLNRLNRKLWNLSEKYYKQYEKEVGDSNGIVWFKNQKEKGVFIFAKEPLNLKEVVAELSMLDVIGTDINDWAYAEKARQNRLNKINIGGE